MTVLLEYLLRVSLIWAVLLLYDQLFLGPTHNWRLRRFYLLLSYLLGLSIPLLPAIGTSEMQLAIPSLQLDSSYLTTSSPALPAGDPVFRLSVWNLLLFLYCIGSLVQLFQMLAGYRQLRRWVAGGTTGSFQQFRLIRHADIRSPFASWQTIFLPQEMDAAILQMACLHEAEHLRSRHTLERLPLLLGQIFFWFHPLQWYFLHHLGKVQEFQADEAVLRHIPAKKYGHILIQQSMRPTKRWRAGLFASPLKERIHMMLQKKKQAPWRLPQIGLFLGLVAILLFSCSDLLDNASPDLDDLFQLHEVDQLPTLISSDQQGSPEEGLDRVLLETIYKDIHYPAPARQAGITGKVQTQIVIDETGKQELILTNVRPAPSSPAAETIVVVGYGNTDVPANERSTDLQILEEEVKRVIEALPGWRPAVKGGEPVPVVMELAFVFKLE